MIRGNPLPQRTLEGQAHSASLLSASLNREHIPPVGRVRYKFAMTPSSLMRFLPHWALVLWLLSPTPTPLKRCTICKQEKPLTRFNFRWRSKSRLQPACKACNRAASRAYYRRNRTKHIRAVTEHKRARQAEARLYVVFHLLKNPCVDCGETDPVVLEFDHVRGDKLGNISRLIWSGCSQKKLVEEIAKCEVRCANCHRRRTARQFGWWKYDGRSALSKLGKHK